VAEWSAEVVVDEPFARRLLGSQFPELALDSLVLLGEGWDNTVWLVDGQWVFRFPRRQQAVPGIERQLAVLPRLAPHLPLRVPVPAFAGVPADGFPWRFSGHELLPGREPAEAAASETERARWARPLGAFLRALHDPELLELDGVGGLPVDPMGRADMTFRVGRTRERFAELAELDLWRPPADAAALLAEAERLPAPDGLAVTHGDLHLRHVLVEGDRPTAVIDWDDLCRGDPAIDLVPHWSLLPAQARPEFLDAYGEVTEPRLLRARVLSLFLCGTLAVYGRREGLPSLEREALAGLERTVAG
jgi:aminoglycoside phosphotransferase (APT) family kinase protein